MLIAAAVAVALIAACVALINWRWAVVILIAWGLAEGLVRRSLPGQPAEVMLIDDGLTLLIYGSFLMWYAVREDMRMWKPPFMVPLLLFCLLAVGGIFNPQSPGILFGLLGFHSYIWYVPLLWVGLALFQDLDSARKFFWWLCIATIPLTLLAVYQYVNYESLPDVLKPVKGDALFHSNLSQGLEAIRQVPSAFVNAEKFSRYCLMTFCLSLGLLVDHWGARFRRAAVGVALVSSAIGIFLSGRRTPMYFSLVGFAWLMFGYYTKLGVRKSMQWITVLVLIGAGIAFTSRTQNPNTQYYQQSTADFYSRANWAWSDMAASFKNAGLIGAGTGTLSQGMGYIPGGLEWAYSPSSSLYIWGETGLGKVTEELGLTGAIAFVVFLLTMGISWFTHLRRLRGTAAYPVGAALAVYFSLMIAWFAKGHMILGDPITLVQFWLCMGVFFALPSYLHPRPR